MGDILGDFGSILAEKNKKESQIESIDFGDYIDPKTVQLGQQSNLLDTINEGANALDRGILKTPVAMMDFAATLGSSLAGTDITQDKLYQAARGYEETVNDQFASQGKLSPTTNAILEGVGQIGGQIGTAALTGGTSATAQMMKPVAGMTIAGTGTTQGIQDAVESKASPEDIKTSAVLGSVIGLTEFAPVEKILGIANKAAPGIKNKVVNILATGGLEGLQEWVQQGGTNVVAKLTYDEERDLTKGLQQSAQVGGATGIVAATIATLLGVKHIPKMPTSEAESDTITPEVMPQLALPSPTKRSVEKAVDAELIQDQLPDSDVVDPEVMPNLPSTLRRQGATYNGDPLAKIRAAYPEGSARQQYAIAYAEQKLRGNQNTATPPDVIPLEEPSVPADISTEDAELQTLQEMLADPKTTADDKKYLQDRLDEIQGKHTIERRLNDKQRGLVEQLVKEQDIEALSKLIYHDDLTGLMNKRSWDEAERLANMVGADVASLDLAGMKYVNDTFGHSAGDQLFKALGSRLKDSGTLLFRKGGDEFAAVFEKGQDANKILSNLRKEIGHVEIVLTDEQGNERTFSGWSLDYGSGQDFKTADTELYAKRAHAEAIGERNTDRTAQPYGLVEKTTPGLEDDSAQTEETKPVEQASISKSIATSSGQDPLFIAPDGTRLGNTYEGKWNVPHKDFLEETYGLEDSASAIVDEGLVRFTQNDEEVFLMLNPDKADTLQQAVKILSTSRNPQAVVELVTEKTSTNIDHLQGEALTGTRLEVLKQLRNYTPKVNTSTAKPQKVQASKPFTKMGSVWISPVGDGRSIGIIKEGTSYVGYVGTPEEIQQDVADEIGSWPSLPKARKALGEEQEVKVTPKITKVELKNRLEVLKQLNKKAHEKKIEEYLVDYDDPVDAEDFVSWEEMKDEEIAIDFYGDQYETRDGADIAKDIWTILTDDRGAINPKSDPDIKAAKERLGNDVNKLITMAKKAGQAFKYPTSPQDMPVDIDNLWKQFGKILRAHKTTAHPATYTSNFIPVFANILKASKAQTVLDIFGGTGKIGLVKDYGFKGTVIANEIEPIYNGKPVIEHMQQNHVDVPIIGDATNLTIDDDAVDAIITSPTYGNQMAAKRKPGSSQNSYQKSAGILEEQNSGGMYWGPKYEQLHMQAYQEALRVIKPGGIIVINMKDFYRTPALPKGSTVDVVEGIVKASDWHEQALQNVGFQTIKKMQVAAGTELRKHATKRLDYENIIIAQKPLKIDYNQEASEIKSLWKRLNKYLNNERGSVDMSGAYGLAAELGKKIQRLYQELKKAAIKIKEWGLAKKPDSAKVTPEQQSTGMNYLQRTIKNYNHAFKTSMSDIVKEYYDTMKSSDRIVDRYVKGSGVPSVRQVPWIPKSIPHLKEGVENYSIGAFKRQFRTPSGMFRNLFDVQNNPSVDMAESEMAFVTSTANDMAWFKDVSKNFENESDFIRGEFDVLYNEFNELRKASDIQMRKLAVYKAKLRAATDPDKKRMLRDKIKQAQKREAGRMKRLEEGLSYGYDSLFAKLAPKSSSIRVIGQILENLPEGIQLSPEELKFADQLKGYFESTAADLEKRGIPFIKTRQYLPHLIPQILNDPDGQAFARQNGLPVTLKFAHQSESGRVWYPSVHDMMNSYIPMVNKKLAFEPFIQRWTMPIANMPTDINKYMTKWVEETLFRKPPEMFERFVNQLVEFEYVRLTGLSASVMFKHGTKTVDSLMRYDMASNTKAGMEVVRGMAKKIAQTINPNLDIDNMPYELIKAFVNARILLNYSSEFPIMGASASWLRRLAGSGVSLIEFADNGVTLFSTMMAADNANMSVEQASRIIWDTMLAANFRGGHDMPLIYRNPYARPFVMFQSTVQKLWGYRGSILKGAINGEKDAFDTPQGVMLVRLILMMGISEAIARGLLNSTLMDQILHSPYVTHMIEADAGGYSVHYPKTSGSPFLDFAQKTATQNIVKATKDHFSYWGQMTKAAKTLDGSYNRKNYNNAVMYNLGIKSLRAGSKTVHRRGAHRSSGRRR